MSAPRPVGGQPLTYPRTTPDRAEDHPQLLAWYAEQDADDAAARKAFPPPCQCFDVRTGEFTDHYPCTLHRSEALADIDRDGHDDKRETPGQVA